VPRIVSAAWAAIRLVHPAPTAAVVALSAALGAILLAQAGRSVDASWAWTVVAVAGSQIFVGATNDRRFRAFDAATGEELWQTRLDGNANANPMSYAGASGEQRVAVIAGGSVMVYGLP